MNEGRSAIAEDVHKLVQNLLKEGAKPSDVSFVLSMIATELGLKVTRGSISVFPTVLSGISRGVANALEADEVEKEKELEEQRPLGETVH